MFFAGPFFRFMLYRTITAFHHIGDAKTSPRQALILSGASSGPCFARIWMASGLPNFGHWMASGFYPFMMGVHQLTL
jgi:hypothetical protein